MTATFIGHRHLSEEEKAKTEKLLYYTIIDLIANRKVNEFLLGGKSDFVSLCINVLTVVKKIYPRIVRVYVRAEKKISSIEHLLVYVYDNYEYNIFPYEVQQAKKARCVIRNKIIIDRADYCVFYYNGRLTISDEKRTKRSSTEIAYNYAMTKNKSIINLYQKNN